MEADSKKHTMQENYQSKEVGMVMKVVKRMILVILVLVLAAFYSYGIWPRAIYDSSIGSGSYEVTGALTGDMAVEQQFQCEDNGFSGITIKLTKQDNAVIGEYQWLVQDVEAGTVIGSGIINETSTENEDFESGNVQKQGVVELEFPRVENSKGKNYVLSIVAQDVRDDQAMAVYITEKGETGSKLTVEQQEIEKACVVKVEYRRFNVETFIVFLVIMAYLLAFIRFMYKLFR